MNIYSENLLDHAKNPRNVGKFSRPDGYGEETNTSCGDGIEVYIKKGKIKYEMKGCAIATATASMLSERDLKEIAKMNKEDLIKLLKVDLTPGRVPCAMLPFLAIKKALGKEQGTRNKKQR